MKTAAWIQGGVLACLLGLLTVLFSESRDGDRTARRRTLEALRTLQLHDAELSRDVLLARAGQLADYDPLMADRQQLLRDREALAQTVARGSGALAAVVRPHQGALERALGDKLAAVEHFKSDNALARNSLMYLTHPADSTDREAELQRLRAADSARLQHALLRFIETLDSEAGEAIRGELDRLAKFAVGSNPPLEVAHGRLVVDLLPSADTLLRAVLGAPTTQHARAFDEALAQYAAQAEARAQTVRYALFAFSVLMFGYLVHQFVLIRRGAARLSATNTRLQLEAADRAQVELDLRDAEQRYRAIAQFAHEAIVSTDSGGCIVSWNRGAESIFGLKQELVLGKPLSLLMPKRLRRDPRQGFSQWHEQDPGSGPIPATVETVALHADGREFAVEISRSSWTTTQGRFESGIIRDINERRRLEAVTRQQELQLIQANRMTVMGKLVSFVSHEVNNPNHWIMQNASTLATVWSDAREALDAHAAQDPGFTLAALPYAEMRERVPRLVSDIEAGARRIDTIVRDLKDFAQARTIDGQASFALDETVHRAVRLLGWLIPQRTQRFSLHLAEQLPAARGNAGQIEQVLVNLLTNALEALPDAQHGVSVSTAHVAARHEVVVVVRDQGCGIDPANLPRLGEPFFTTKLAQGGTGLGLALSAALVRAHGGRLEFASIPGQGTQVTLSLPCAAPAGPGP